MLIENLELFKGWLTGCLQPLCDADPGALAKYVIALVKKDKPDAELRALCLDQLEVFFQKETKPFVDLLFETLTSKSYLRQNQQQQSGQQRPNNTSGSAGSANSHPASASANSHAASASVSALQAADRTNSETSYNGTAIAKDLASSLPKGSVSGSSKSDNKRPKGSSEGEERDAKRTRQQRSKSRSRSPVTRGSGRGKGDSRESDDRRSRRFLDDDRRRRSFTNRRYENRYRDFRDRRSQEGTDRERDRDGRSSQRKERRDKVLAPENERSKSRSWSRSWSRSVSRSPSRSRSRSWSRIRERSRDQTRNECREPRSTVNAAANSGSTNSVSNNNPGGSTSNVSVSSASAIPLAGDHGDKDYRLSNANVASSAPINAQPAANDGNHFRGGKQARRCRDYDEKGYCMRGDLCPYDHGADPVVVEDVSVLGFPHSANVPPPHESYIPEPYNPEAPGMERGPPRMRSSFWHPGGPQNLAPTIRPPASHQRGPPPHMFHGGPPPRTRELIGVPTVDDPPERIDSPTSKSVLSQRTVLSPQHQPQAQPLPLQQQQQPQQSLPVLSEVEGNGSVALVDATPSLGLSTNMPLASGPFRDGFKKGPGGRPFDYNRLGPRKSFNPDRCILELRKVPRSLNTIAQLNSHFSKFGTVVNLQVCYTGDPEAALVQFSSHAEANAAYRCTEAVLNNRFIKVFWHNKENAANNTNTPQQQVHHPAAPAQPVHSQPLSAVQPKEAISLPPVAMEVSMTKPSIKERLGSTTTTTKINHFKKINTTMLSNREASLDDQMEKSVLFSPTGNLSRTVFNPAALKKSNVALGVTKKLKEDHKKDTIKKKMELHKKRQLIVLGHLKQQKVLFEKLEKSKNEKEKQEIRQVLIELSKTIEQLRNDVKKDASEITDLTKSIAPSVPKSKAEAEKELLDAEMDLYNKQHRGDDTTELKKKVFDLKQQARALGLLDSSGQLRSLRGGMTFRGRGSFLQRGGTALRRGMTLFRGLSRLTSVDRRPRKILAEGATETERENLYVHFSQIAEVENLEILTNGIVFTFKNRKDAEKAMALASRLQQSPELQQVKTSWFRGNTSLSEDSLLEAEDSALHSVEDVVDHLDDVDLLMGDDEEEEDSEARSWRR